MRHRNSDASSSTRAMRLLPAGRRFVNLACALSYAIAWCIARHAHISWFRSLLFVNVVSNGQIVEPGSRRHTRMPRNGGDSSSEARGSDGGSCSNDSGDQSKQLIMSGEHEKDGEMCAVPERSSNTKEVGKRKMTAYTGAFEEGIVEIIRDLVAMARKTKGCELELRFGKICEGKFEPGISRCMMDEFINRLQTNLQMKSSNWSEIVDYFYPVMKDGKKLGARSRISYNTNYFVVEKEHCFKTKLKNVILCDPKSNVAFKIELSQEQIFETYDMPQVANPNFVRIQQRRSFLYGGNPPGNWKYDFSMTWKGTSKTDAEISQSREEPIFEFEIELTGKQYFEQHDDQYISKSLLMKALDFAGTGSALKIIS